MKKYQSLDILTYKNTGSPFMINSVGVDKYACWIWIVSFVQNVKSHKN